MSAVFEGPETTLHEAQQGHGALAHDIRQIVDKAKSTRPGNVLLKFPQGLEGLLFSEHLLLMRVKHAGYMSTGGILMKL